MLNTKDFLKLFGCQNPSFVLCLVGNTKEFVRRQHKGIGACSKHRCACSTKDFPEFVLSENPRPLTALRDLTTDATLAFDHDNPVERDAAKLSWQTVAKEFWERQNASYQAEKGRSKALKKTLHRVKVYEWLCASQQTLSSLTGRGWEQFMVPGPDEEQRDPAQWKSITVALGQGGDGWSACYYLQSSRTNMFTIGDPSHRYWNDFINGVKKSGQWLNCLLLINCCNLDHGPWSGARYWEEMKEAASEYCALASTDCLHFSSLLPAMFEENKEDLVLVPHEERSEMLWDGLKEIVKKKTEKVASTRWFQMVHAFRHLSKQWSQRYCLGLYLCLQLGLMTTQRVSDLVKTKLAVRSEQADVSKAAETTKNDRESVRKLRASCKNTLLFTTLILGNMKMYRLCVLIGEVGAVFGVHHTKSNTENRSVQASAQWWLEQVRQGGLHEIRDLLRLFSSISLLEKLQLHVFKAGSRCYQADVGDSIVAEEDEAANLAGDLIMSVASMRLRSVLQYHNYPHRFAMLLSDNAEMRQDCANHFKEYWTRFQSLNTLPNPFWRKVTERAGMNSMKCQQMLKLFQRSGWAVSEEILSVARADFRSITQTKLVEDLIREERAGEVTNSGNKTKCPERCWEELLRGSITSGKHHFDDIGWRDENILRGLKDLSCKQLFRVTPGTMPLDFKRVVSFAKKAPYTTAAAGLFGSSVEDFALHEWLEKEGRVGEGSSSWRQVAPILRHLWRLMHLWHSRATQSIRRGNVLHSARIGSVVSFPRRGHDGHERNEHSLLESIGRAFALRQVDARA